MAFKRSAVRDRLSPPRRDFCKSFFYFSVEISIRRKVRKIYNNYLKNEKLSKQIAKIKNYKIFPKIIPKYIKTPKNIKNV